MDNIRKILKSYWGFDAFRPMQEEIIRSVLEGRDTLALLPTGGGKSLCYQVPAMASDGLCIVVSPLIALMKDQVEQLQARGIKAAVIFSGMRPAEIDTILDNCVYGPYKFLFLSPERLENDLAKERISRMKLNLIAVDEAHCISQWGYDFRPAYLQIASLRELHPECPVLALTATATERVRDDIQAQLRFKGGRLLKSSFYRKNLAYQVMREENKNGRLLKICQQMVGSGIIYARNRRQTEQIATFLKKSKISAACYHAGLPMKKREQVQDDWLKGRIRVMVATNAFGMGIDKADVRFVLHIDPPESLEAYFQEAGRAGRDGRKATAMLLFSPADEKKLLESVDISYPAISEIRNIYQALGNFFQVATGAGAGLSFDFDIGEFCRRYDFFILKVLNAFRVLEKQQYLSFSEGVYLPSRIKLLLEKEALYRFQVAHAEFDPILKAILRSCAGVFDFYVPLDERLVARRAGLVPEEFIRSLRMLARRKAIAYLPHSDKPQVTYLRERADARHLYLDAAYLKDRRGQHLARVHSVLNYIKQEDRCRSRQLLAYFGEADSGNCGLCDVCLNLNEAAVDQVEFDRIKTLLEAALKEGPLSQHALIDRLPGVPELKALFVLRILLDDRKIIKSEDEATLSLKNAHI